MTRIRDSGEHLSETLFNALVLNGLPERYEHFIVQESFNPAGTFVELRTRLTNYEESRAHRENDSEGQHVSMATRSFGRTQQLRGTHTAESTKNGETKLKASLGPCFCLLAKQKRGPKIKHKES